MDAERALDLLELLERRVITSGPALARAMKLDGRGLRREIERLAALDLGLEIVRMRGRRGGYGLGRGDRVPPLVLTEDEALAVVVALRFLRRHADPRKLREIDDVSELAVACRIAPARAAKYAPAEALFEAADPLLSRIGRLLPRPALGRRAVVERSLALAAEALAAQRLRDAA